MCAQNKLTCSSYTHPSALQIHSIFKHHSRIVCSAKQNYIPLMPKIAPEAGSTLCWETASVYTWEKDSEAVWLTAEWTKAIQTERTTEDWQVSKQTDTCPHAHASYWIRRRKYWQTPAPHKTLPSVRSLPKHYHHHHTHAQLSQGFRETKEVVGAPEASGKTLEKLSGAAGFMLRCYLGLCRETGFDVLSHRQQAEGNRLVK